ncbi:SAF domain-containing protein [Streptomonospora wellingtoniae]|uniref:SAF domain-containing protein n=1 Tax=Streptomonospora wellingtoniae TaxID=3075544 RepID=A0ABU2KWI6_9ACTN|nr:SAF domain-containing protein [Streptomonospora sp. DSM 45055]MDT0303615.1 SAF domain-containing protein [Streptomonospora sp. DSM 45055]
MSTTTGARPAAAESRPTTGPPQVRLLGSGPRRWRWLGLGVAIMAAGALAGVAAVERLDEREAVLVAGGDLSAGHVLTAADLEVARMSVSPGVSVVEEGSLQDAVGSTLTVPVPEGGVLPESALGPSAEYPADGKAVVGAVLAPGRFPVSLERGAAVSVVLVDDSASGAGSGAAGSGGAAGGESAGPASGSGVTAYPARVQSVEISETDGSASVEFVVDADAAGQVSAAAAAERAAVVQVRPRGQS